MVYHIQGKNSLGSVKEDHFITFGAQNTIADILAGMFLVFEDVDRSLLENGSDTPEKTQNDREKTD